MIDGDFKAKISSICPGPGYDTGWQDAHDLIQDTETHRYDNDDLAEELSTFLYSKKGPDECLLDSLSCSQLETLIGCSVWDGSGNMTYKARVWLQSYSVGWTACVVDRLVKLKLESDQ